MSLLSSSIGSVRCLADEEADNNMLQDLQLAAELGKTLLERNKELENIIKIHQSTIEEQAQEIEYMKKQTAALREVNDSRLKIYEQLEVSIQDLERANHRLVVENTSDKKLIKSQCLTIENLETRCEELQKKIDELHSQREVLLRQQTTNQNLSIVQTQTASWKAAVTPGGSIRQSAAPTSPKAFQETITDTVVQQSAMVEPNEEELTDLLRQLQEARSQRTREQKKVAELSQQLTNLLLENSTLEEQLNVWRSKAQDVKNLQDEINTLEEVRRGQLCGRCLRGMDSKNHDELSVLDSEDYDVISIAGSLINEQPHSEPTVQDTCTKADVTSEVNPNPYRELVEKYQALLEVQRLSAPRRKNSIPAACMSLQEELEMSGEFNCFQNTPAESELQQENGKSTTIANGRRVKAENVGKKAFSATPTDFSEAETSSSGFSDETSNKATQTDGRPGSFLCSIADGEDCKFSIYDDNSPFESRFRKTPEYRQLFSEIFGVLKRAAEAKDEGEKLPLLDEQTNNSSDANDSSRDRNNISNLSHDDVPSETTDDNQSVMSSVVSSVVSEPPYRMQTPVSTKESRRDQSNNKSDSNNKHERMQNGVKRLDYVSVNVHVRNKNSAKKHAAKKLSYNERSETPDIVPTTNPKFVPPKSTSGGKRRFRPLTAAEQDGTNVWNGSTHHSHHHHNSRTRESPNIARRSHTYVNRNVTEQHNNSFEYGEYKPSTASQEVAKLKRLELSYAEVLRMANKSKASHDHRS
ncbi:hypothetical protein KPH14_009250 [Odynerus spinipes]|uniref:Cerebellar degeneration-related protein 2 n=1 Tax=Odynerus spinipes TaxID=1348599 RepID=A0AAD9VRB9_9HYME|nr:hypothetical protein KPH14_009250 [Odynerus spinipes]